MLPSEPGVSVESIADGLFVTMPAQPSTIAVARVTLAPDEHLRWSPSAGPVIVHVDAGDVALDANGPVPWLQASDRSRAMARDGSEIVQGTIVERGEALLDTSAEFDLRAGVPGAAIIIIALIA